MTVVHIDLELPASVTLDREGLRQSAETALMCASAQQESELTVRVTGDEELQELNRQYRGQDETTDVLSFPDGEVNPENGMLYLGDILIAYPQAERQAQENGQAVSDEVRLLVVHGVLHLLGYDHHDPADRETMWALQSTALIQLGISHDIGDWE